MGSDAERYIDVFQRDRKQNFRGLSVVERVGKLLVDTMRDDNILPHVALQKALRTGDLDAAVEISQVLLPPVTSNVKGPDESSQMSGEIG